MKKLYTPKMTHPLTITYTAKHTN